MPYAPGPLHRRLGLGPRLLARVVQSSGSVSRARAFLRVLADDAELVFPDIMRDMLEKLHKLSELWESSSALAVNYDKTICTPLNLSEDEFRTLLESLKWALGVVDGKGGDSLGFMIGPRHDAASSTQPAWGTFAWRVDASRAATRTRSLGPPSLANHDMCTESLLHYQAALRATSELIHEELGAVSTKLLGGPQSWIDWNQAHRVHEDWGARRPRCRRAAHLAVLVRTATPHSSGGHHPGPPVDCHGS